MAGTKVGQREKSRCCSRQEGWKRDDFKLSERRGKMRKVSVGHNFTGNGGVFKLVAHGPHQTYKHVCLSHTIIFHWRQHLETKTFHIKRDLPAQGWCFHVAITGWSSDILSPDILLALSHLPAPGEAESPLLAGCTACGRRGGVTEEGSARWQTFCSLCGFPPKRPWASFLTFWSSVWPSEQ